VSGTWIVIVNYRTAELVVDCLRSLSAQAIDLVNVRLVVVDNASEDGSVEKLNAAIEQEEWFSWVTVMPLDKNGGFAYGNNASIRMAIATKDSIDYVMLLNPDTVVRPGAVKTLVDFMDANPEVGIAGSRLENVNGKVECSAHTFPSPLGGLDEGARLGMLSRLLHRYAVTFPMKEVAHSCDWVSGASMIIRRQVFEDIGLLDEGYFLYFEEVDFCYRVRQNGWQCWYVPDSRVIHLEGASTEIGATTKRRANYWFDSRRRFYVKHYGIAGLIATDAFWLTGRLLFLLRRFFHLGTRNYANDIPKRFMLDLLWGDLQAIFSGKVWSITSSKQRR